MEATLAKNGGKIARGSPTEAFSCTCSSITAASCPFSAPVWGNIGVKPSMVISKIGRANSTETRWWKEYLSGPKFVSVCLLGPKIRHCWLKTFEWRSIRNVNNRVAAQRASEQAQSYAKLKVCETRWRNTYMRFDDGVRHKTDWVL